MNSKNNSADSNRISLIIYLMLILAAGFAEFMSFDKNQPPNYDVFSLAAGLGAYFALYMHSQKIISNNSFKQFAGIGIVLFCICFLKQWFIGFHPFPLFVAGLPLLYLVYFRLMTTLFFKNYPLLSKKPNIIFVSGFGPSYFEDKEKGYKPSMKERVFSLLISLGFMLFVFGLMLIFRNIISVSYDELFHPIKAFAPKTTKNS